MNKNVTPLILIVLAIGIYFTFTRVKIDELASVRVVNAQYKDAIKNSEELVKVRDSVLDDYNKISPQDRKRLDKLIPNNVDNVRLIIDIGGIANKHGLTIKNVRTSAGKDSAGSSGAGQQSSSGPSSNPQLPGEFVSDSSGGYNTVTFSFDTSASYQTFLLFLKDLEVSLRILEISKISLKANDTGIYDYGVELKTFWLKQ